MNYQLTSYPNPSSAYLPLTPNSVLGKRPQDQDSNQGASSSSSSSSSSSTSVDGPSMPDYLSKFMTKEQFLLLQRGVNLVEQKNPKKPYYNLSRQDYNIMVGNQPELPPFTITRRDNDIFVHLMKLGDGTSKKAKAIADLQTNKIFTRMIWKSTDQDWENELKILKLAMGLEGVIQLRRDSDIKDKKGFILDYYPFELLYLIRENSIRMTDIVGIIIQAATGLKNLHNKMIVHGDVKLENFLTDFDPANPTQGKTVITDFNLAVTNDSKGIRHLSTGCFGTTDCMAPEMKDIDKRTKIIKDKLKSNLALANESLLLKSAAECKNLSDQLYFELGKKMDIYSFGILLREALFQMPAGASLNPRIKLTTEGKEVELSSSLLVGNNRCPQAFNDIPGMQNLNALITCALSDDPWSRPSMEEIITSLTTLKPLIPTDLTVIPIG